MKRQLMMLLPLLAMALLTGCSTYQYSSRYVGINRTPINTKRASAEVVVDYNRMVTATSDYQMTKNDAIKEAEHLCIVNNSIDVVVDPIFKVEYSPFNFQKRYKATVTGYAGKYAPAKSGVDAAKDYDMKDIEKYKMLTDPAFPKYYYNKGTGDSYYINTKEETSGAVRASSASLAFAPKKAAPKVRQFDFDKARKLRNTGIGLTIGGVLSALVIGVPCLASAETYEYDEYYGHTYYYNESAGSAGAIFMTAGCLSALSGIPCWIVGSTRMKKANRNADISMGGTRNGVGLRLRF